MTPRQPVRYVDNSWYTIFGWVVSCMNTCGRVSLITSMRAVLLVSSALAFPSASNSPQMVSNFTTKPADSSAELHGRFRVSFPIQVVAQATHPVHVLHTCVPAPAKLPCRRGCRRARIVRRWLLLTPSQLVPGGTTRTACSVGAFRTPYDDPLSSLLSERPVWRNPVVAEGIIPSLLRVLR